MCSELTLLPILGDATRRARDARASSVSRTPKLIMKARGSRGFATKKSFVYPGARAMDLSPSHLQIYLFSQTPYISGLQPPTTARPSRSEIHTIKRGSARKGGETRAAVCEGIDNERDRSVRSQTAQSEGTKKVDDVPEHDQLLDQ